MTTRSAPESVRNELIRKHDAWRSAEAALAAARAECCAAAAAAFAHHAIGPRPLARVLGLGSTAGAVSAARDMIREGKTGHPRAVRPNTSKRQGATVVTAHTSPADAHGQRP